MERCEDILACKCGIERADVNYGKSRLLLAFITINVVAGAMGVDILARSFDKKSIYTLGRGSLTARTSDKGGTISTIDIAWVDLTKKNACDAAHGYTDSKGKNILSKSDCNKMKGATQAYLTFGCSAVVLMFFLLLFLLRIECRRLVSQPMRWICLTLAVLSFCCTVGSWLALVLSPIGKTFDFYGNSFWSMIGASVTSLALLYVSVKEFMRAMADPMAAADYK